MAIIINKTIFNLLILISITFSFIQISQANNCDPIEECSPQFAAFDTKSLNKTIQISCKFNKIIDPNDILWQFRMNKQDRTIKDFDDQILPPFKHQIINTNYSYSSKPHSISVLTIPLINSSYYANYTIFSIPGSCYQTVRINYQEAGKYDFLNLIYLF